MKLVDRNDIQNWADTFDSKSTFPYLISRLVRASTPIGTQIDIPSGSSAYMGGWDGIVKCERDTEKVPAGISLWEFGTDVGVKGKADDDYETRTKDSLGYKKEDSVFIFVTPRVWKNKHKWQQSKTKEGIWKEVRVYDSRDVEQWFDSTISVARWFSAYVGRFPFDGIVTADEFWEEWAIGPKGKLSTKTITSGRDIEKDKLLNFLIGEPGIRGVKASSKVEALAFIIACAKEFEINASELFFSKTLIVDSEANYRAIRINNTNPLNLIPRFEDPLPLYAAVSRGHHVLVPLGGDDIFNQDTLVLPTVYRDGQIDGLVNMGLSKEDAEKYSREAGRNVTILKKLIGFPDYSANWLKDQKIDEIIPALLLGRWNEKHQGDLELLEKLSGQPYDKYIKILTKWRDIEESPIIQIGETWRLISPLDTWISLSGYISAQHLESLRLCFLFAFQNGNPSIDDESELSKFISPTRKFSAWAREGLSQSLILIGLYGDGLKIHNLISSKLWVDELMTELLSNSDSNLWVSLDHELPLLSEASPQVFIEELQKSLSIPISPILKMFEEKEGFITSTSHHTGLLWALEGLAWIPEYLRDVTSILLKLASIDPGGSLSNRPINSLIEIFKPWHYQTLSSFDERIAALEYGIRLEKEQGWKLLLSMLPDHHGVAHPTHKLRWRLFNENLNLTYTYKEIGETHSYVVDFLISLFDNSEDRLIQLLEESVKLSPNDRAKILSLADSAVTEISQSTFSTWHGLRKLLNHHRSFPDADWSLPEKELSKYQILYDHLKPSENILKYKWLFDDQWPEFPEGFVHDMDSRNERYDEQQRKIDEARESAFKAILSEYGIEQIVKLSGEVKEPWSLGETSAKIVTEYDQILKLCQLLKEKNGRLNFIHNFIRKKSLLNGVQWCFELYEKLKVSGIEDKFLAQIFVPLKGENKVWQFIDNTNDIIKAEYWNAVRPNFFHISSEEKIIGLKYLLEYKRYFSAIDACSHYPQEIPSELIVEILKKAAIEESNETFRIREYEINRLFNELDKRNDVEHKSLIQLEWFYIPILSRYGSSRNPKRLHSELASNPDFFIDVLKWVYMPKNKKLLEEERKGIEDSTIESRARQAYDLLNSWKSIPGVSVDGKINKEFLNEWIDKVRSKAVEVDRKEICDFQIGKILAQYPEEEPLWPPDEICEVIERINTESLLRNFSAATRNKRSFSSRGPFEGGDIERGHAKLFKRYSESRKSQFPIVSKVLGEISNSYLFDAKRMDDEAERDRLEY